jgi:hypothetical protein
MVLNMLSPEHPRDLISARYSLLVIMFSTAVNLNINMQSLNRLSVRQLFARLISEGT